MFIRHVCNNMQVEIYSRIKFSIINYNDKYLRPFYTTIKVLKSKYRIQLFK